MAAIAITSAGGCESTCVDVNTACTPLYEPTFDNVYQNTLAVSCSVGNGTCHTDDGQAVAGGLSFATIDQAYAALTGGGFADPADVGCSPLSYRLQTTGADVMPPGSPLQEAERCAVIQWIENGAAR